VSLALILGISASGRSAVKNDSGLLVKGVTEELVKYVLEKSGEPHEFVSLAGKTIKGCMGCVRCAKDNICMLQDDWAPIRDKMLEADAIIFGAPNYYGIINALGHAFLERTFSLRHRERFPLAGKLNVIVASGSEEETPVEAYIKSVFRSNYMAEPIGVLCVSGVSQCYLCGYGQTCAAGSVVAKHGFVDSIRDYQIPRIDPDVYCKADIIAHRLGEIVRGRKANSKQAD
jgi:multimeric flavodoxin WrbA